MSLLTQGADWHVSDPLQHGTVARIPLPYLVDSILSFIRSLANRDSLLGINFGYGCFYLCGCPKSDCVDFGDPRSGWVVMPRGLSINDNILGDLNTSGLHKSSLTASAPFTVTSSILGMHLLTSRPGRRDREHGGYR